MSKDENQKLFSERRKELVDRQLSNSEAQDKAILTLSTSILMISISFMRYFVDLNLATNTCLLYISWALFALAVVSTIISFLIGQKAIDSSIDIAYKYYIEDNDDYENFTPLSSRINDKVNIFSSLSFIFAVISIVAFISLNLSPRGKEMSQDKVTKVFTTDSAPVPKLQKKSATIPKQQPKSKPSSTGKKK